MRRYSRFDCAIWGEPWFRELPDDSPLLWLWLNHNSHTLACGLWEIDLECASQETLLPKADIARWLTAWQQMGLLRSDGRFILLPHYTKQQGGFELQRAARRQAIALASETQLAVEWLERQRGQNVDQMITRVGTR
jgi:hypothetical protein